MRDKRLNATLFALLLLMAPALAEEPAAPAKPLPPGLVKIAVNDLHCATCAKKCARKLYAVKGVREVKSSVKNNLLFVKLPPKQTVPVVQLWNAVQSAGFQPVRLRHGAAVYDAERIEPLLAQARSASLPR